MAGPARAARAQAPTARETRTGWQHWITWSVNNGIAFSCTQVPGYIDSDDLKPRGDIMSAFGRYLHMSHGLLASSVMEYLIQVCTAHTARGIASPRRGPEYKLMMWHLEQDAAESPERAYVISSTMVRMMLFESTTGNDEDHAMTAILMLFTGGRPVEILGNDNHAFTATRGRGNGAAARRGRGSGGGPVTSRVDDEGKRSGQAERMRGGRRRGQEAAMLGGMRALASTKLMTMRQWQLTYMVQRQGTYTRHTEIYIIPS